MSSTKIWIPETIKIPVDHQYHDQMLKLINHLLVKRNARSKTKRDNPIKLNKELLRSLAGGEGGRHGAKVRDELERIGFLTVVKNQYGNKTYRAKHYSIKVIINQEHCEAELVEHTLHRKPRVKATHNSKNKMTDVIKYMLDNLKKITSSHIQIDNLIKEDMSDHAIKCLKHTLNMLNLGQHYGNRDNKGKRFFSSFTSVQKSLRRQCKIEGQDLVEIDVKSCQPLLLTKIISDHIRGNETLLSDHIEGNNKNQSIEQLEELNNEIKLINLLCKSGEFYEQFEHVRKCEALGIDDTHKLKRDFCQAFFNYWSCFIKHPFSHAFLKKFPRSWLVVSDLKQKFERDWHIPPNERHSQLACKLQRMESNCLIDGVIGGLIEDGVDLPVVTIHDAILTTAPHVEEMKQRIKHSFLNSYGLDVGLGVKL